MTPADRPHCTTGRASRFLPRPDCNTAEMRISFRSPPRLASMTRLQIWACRMVLPTRQLTRTRRFWPGWASMTSSRTWPVSGRLPGSAIPSLLSVTPATGLRQGQAEGPICSAAGPRSRRPRTPPPPLSNQLSFVASVGVDDAFASLDELTRLMDSNWCPACRSKHSSGPTNARCCLICSIPCRIRRGGRSGRNRTRPKPLRP
jgi:hypothetical protein